MELKRLTTNRPWETASGDLSNEKGYQWIWQRLNAIEDILGDEYDLNRLRELVEVRHGRWIKHEGYDECSECHAKSIMGHNYCHSCGALMREVGSGEK